MYHRSTSLLLKLLKVPPEPHAPFGDPASLRIFRAGQNFFKLRLLTWSIGQAAALAGIIFWAALFFQVEERARVEKATRAAQAAAAPAQLEAKPTPTSTSAPALENASTTPNGTAKKSVKRKRPRVGGWEGFVQAFVQLALVIPPWAFPVIWAIKILGFLLYLIQIPLTYSVLRLDYEMRWYVVTDRSLRIRSGVWSVQELTMSFANLQQVVVTQGPLQRLLKLADVRVQSAGGGSSESAGHHGSHGDSLHSGHFHGVENADEIRDLILARLKRFRESGLGDPDESHSTHRAVDSSTLTKAAPLSMGQASATVAAARELAAEARALREALS